MCSVIRGEKDWSPPCLPSLLLHGDSRVTEGKCVRRAKQHAHTQECVVDVVVCNVWFVTLSSSPRIHQGEKWVLTRLWQEAVINQLTNQSVCLPLITDHRRRLCRCSPGGGERFLRLENSQASKIHRHRKGSEKKEAGAKQERGETKAVTVAEGREGWRGKRGGERRGKILGGNTD